MTDELKRKTGSEFSGRRQEKKKLPPAFSFLFYCEMIK